MTIPARTIREIGELCGASRAVDIAAVLNVHQSRLPQLTGVRRHVYTTDDCYPAAVGRLQAMASELLIEREELLATIARHEARIEAHEAQQASALRRPVYVPPIDDAELAEFDAAVAADYPERRRG